MRGVIAGYEALELNEKGRAVSCLLPAVLCLDELNQNIFRRSEAAINLYIFYLNFYIYSS